ncbi:Pentatricopeptide repeat [Dillenia turbinata]|uniref:Pentatricopeptide repeat n=1 Tax=Dillenia turbinata TaxID=194707 RepID=A0AAN8UU01_9MAGN
MEATTKSLPLPTPPPTDPQVENIQKRLLQKGVYPTPKIIRTLRKKQLQKSLRKSKRQLEKSQIKPLSDSQQQAESEENQFRTICNEYRQLKRVLKTKNGDEETGLVSIVGKPWEGFDGVKLREILDASVVFDEKRKLQREHLRALGEVFEERNKEEMSNLFLKDDVSEEEGGGFVSENRKWDPERRQRRFGEKEAVGFLVQRLSGKDLTAKDWKFSRIMKQSRLQFTEVQLLKIVGGLGASGNWRPALSVVEWVYGCKELKLIKSRFVYTKLLAVLGKARRPNEALRVFNLMREECHIYPDMAAYHSYAVTLGQAGLLNELINVIEHMRQKPSKRVKNVYRKNWNPILEPDVVVYNAVLNACVPSNQWKGVFWVFKQLRKNGLKPNGATYGLAMEVMLRSGKYDLVHEFFRKMRNSGEPPKALTYKVLVRAFWEEGKVNDAIEAVRDMEQRGVVGSASVYYELACCLCSNGMWQEAIMEIEKLKGKPLTKPLEVTFTGMIMSSLDGGHVDDCLSLFEHMKDHCCPNIGTINAMLKVYGKNDMFSKAKELYEQTKITADGQSLIPDLYTYSSMLEASASAQQWEYFESVYKEMSLSGFQIDQNKHAWMLVEASKAGKWYLLEHAFDTILEAGEIPHEMMFTELICQATAQHNFDRAVTLVNAMAYAPFQICQKQWTELFEKNTDRFDGDCLSQLLNSLYHCDRSKEATVSNLIRSLCFLCEYGTSKDSSSVTAVDKVLIRISSLDSMDMKSSEYERENLHSLTEDKIDSHNANQHIPTNDNDATSDVSSFDLSIHEGVDPCREDVGRSPKEVDHGNAGTDVPFYEGDDDQLPNESADNFDDDRILAFIMDGNGRDIAKMENEVEHNQRSDLPSANEILETWQESRKREGLFLPFQFGCR